MNREQATTFLAFIIGYIGGGFHPDNKMSDYVNGKTGEMLFTDEQCKRYDAMLDQAWAKFGDDIYDVSMELMNKFMPLEEAA